MFGLHRGGVEPRRHRLDALALTGPQQAGAVGLRRGHPARMPQHTGNRIQISRQPRFAGQRLSCSFLIHHPYMGWLDKNNTVRLRVCTRNEFVSQELFWRKGCATEAGRTMLG